MRNDQCGRARVRIPLLAAGLALIAGCAEVQQAAEEHARRTGNPQLAQAIQGTGTLISGLLPIGAEEELSLGTSIALQVVARSGGIYEQPDLTRYVNLVGRAVAATCDRPSLDYHFAVLNDQSINAFATPGGYVFVTRGLLKQVTNEAELAAVLGHEIAHISQKHMLDVIQRTKQIAGISQAGLAYANQDPRAFQQLIDGVTKKLLDEGYDQGKETEADQLGAVFAARVGYDATAYLNLLKRLRDLKGDDRGLFKTHPNFSARIAAVEATVREKGYVKTGVVLAERFGQVGSKL
jgi:predicted Zn-dependent protease